MTSTEEEGSCVQITDCESLDQIFGQNMSKEKISFLKSSGCGFDNEIPKICCPLRPAIVTKPNIEDTQPEETTTSEAPATKSEVPTTTVGISDEFDFKLRDGE